jgi:hypothetical protein
VSDPHGLAKGIDLELRHGLTRLLDDRFLPLLQLPEEVGAMPRAHEFFAVRRAVALGQNNPVESFEIVAAIKVDKCGRHIPSPWAGANIAKAQYAAPAATRATGAAGSDYC